MTERPRITKGPSDETPYPCHQGLTGAYCNHAECRPAPVETWPCLSGLERQGYPARCRHEGCRPVAPPTAVRPPEPPVRVPVDLRPPGGTSVTPSRLTPAQIIRAEALRCATSGGPRSPENAISDAKRYADWITDGG